MRYRITEGPQIDRVRQLFQYSPETGEFVVVVSTGTRYAGTLAGTTNSNGYRQISVDGRVWLAHRLAWLCLTGEWPEKQIDHIDGNKTNNSAANLRLSTGSQNCANRGCQSNSKSGIKGVWFVPKDNAWTAMIRTKRKGYHLGYFGTPEEASAAYAEAAKNMFGEFARSG